MPRRIALFGATGSIGRNTLEVIRSHPDRFRLVAVSAHTRYPELLRIVEAFRPEVAVLTGRSVPPDAPEQVQWLEGKEGLEEVARREDVDTLVVATGSVLGVFPTLVGLEMGKRVALANKETLVSFGPVVKRVLQHAPGELIPVDSEHSALFQLWEGYRDQVEELWLTASGGPFRTLPAEEFPGITPEQALRHPSWRMGPKITVDSATLMNKALEVIEAERLFGVSPEQIRVVIHPQSVVHGLVRLRDGALMAQLSWPDMKLPIQYALTYPDRIPCPVRPLNFEELLTLTFEPPDHQRFPALRLAYEALRLGGTAPAILNAVNEVAVEAFLGGRLSFPGISQLVAEALEQLPVEQGTSLDVYLEADQRARVWARAQVGKMH